MDSKLKSQKNRKLLKGGEASFEDEDMIPNILTLNNSLT